MYQTHTTFFFFLSPPVRTPEDSIKRYHKVLQLVNGGFSKAEAYNKMNVDRNTIVMQAPIAELAIANPEEYKSLRATFKKGESIQNFLISVLHGVWLSLM